MRISYSRQEFGTPCSRHGVPLEADALRGATSPGAVQRAVYSVPFPSRVDHASFSSRGVTPRFDHTAFACRAPIGENA